MIKRPDATKRLFVLDTNVLMHDPTALFRFDEHDIFLPMVVLEELDRGKKGLSEVSRNVRQVSRFLDDLLEQAADNDAINLGIPLPSVTNSDVPQASGRLFFQTRQMSGELPKELPGQIADNAILAVAINLQQAQVDTNVILVSKDINLRIKATVLGICAEDYYNDKVLDDVDLLYRGSSELKADFWEDLNRLESWTEDGRTFYQVEGEVVKDWYPNQLIYSPGEERAIEAVVRNNNETTADIELIHDYRRENHSVWGITARNREQNFALNLLMDPEIDFVTLLGQAGTGKTLLTLAAALTQCIEHKRYGEIIMTRVTVPVGEDIGFLPGTEEEKMTPWMGALMDNLEVLNKTDGGDWGRQATNDLLQRWIKIRSLNFMRGRTFLNRFIIIDEAQNLTSKQMKTLITRAGPGTKIVCLGNISQIDTPYLSETTSGLTYVVDHFKNWPHSGHITLLRGERSRLADFASENL
ncbi:MULTISPECIES: PhoH family protein [unclassified Methylophaga]|jgi:PhoH-like ATPase|uniref:PhoH family protein n=1 Tax=unclassified Methylophaga TaxID=2629249 RepID=UPI000C3C005C|nr:MULTISPECIES: PhoH family protein [unclassified Methylophaga]MAL49441.1 phosphate starvation-inducible protein PhoH [Methylophaga sp.]MAP26328.1 phosphate starvation-inducible protein PhoH [Methylophaga sp.]MBP24717.1 phosphate starvation-inducible protein PhoH [Methylophaga sp.]HCC81370.1 phosphate starvation-inducible protein PhoH [Methylophaga sp.]|tara:strand:- start:23 stop:1432 length:1410 start_codon:yes stop_codon:yes gene_type:complete